MTTTAQSTLSHRIKSPISDRGSPAKSLLYQAHRNSAESQASSRTGSHVSHPSLPSRSLNPNMMSEPDRNSDPSSASKTLSSGTGSTSQHSSLSGHPRRYTSELQPSRKLRSQYPRGTTDKHVEYILVASFDIDRGPIMEHQYPVAITGDEHMLAELMLPDQAHVRNQDWTIFFLHKDVTQEEEAREQIEVEERKRRRRKRRERRAGTLIEEEDEPELSGGDEDSSEGESTDSEMDDSSEGPPLVYVLNLVNTKQDKTVKRGAVVKAMAICTRHPFLHIYKPLLLLALDEYFKSPVPETLAMLFDAVNNMDLSLMPRLGYLERQLLQSSENKDLFVEKFEQLIQIRHEEQRRSDTINGSIDASHSPPRRPTIHRAGTKAHLQGAGDFSVPRDTHEFETKVMYKGIPIPIKVPVAVMPENVGDFSLIKLIQNFSDAHTKSPQPFPVHAHLTTNGPHTHPIMVLVNALLTQKRVIFLGHNMPSGEVAEAVLAACALVSGGVLRGFTRHAFPYTDLTKIDDLLNVPGFIAGVTNPTFEMHPEWWDLLCDLPSGRIKMSSRIEPAPTTEALIAFQQQNMGNTTLMSVSTSMSTSSANQDLCGDQAFMSDILRSVAARHGERVVRAKWRDWIIKFTRVAAAFEASVYGASALTPGTEEANGSVASGVAGGHGYVWHDEVAKQRELGGNATRIEGWRGTRSYHTFIQDTAQFYAAKPLKSLDLHHLHDRLRTQRLTQAQTREIFLTCARYIKSYDEICLLLSIAPEGHAGLFYVALGLFHKDLEVRTQTLQLLERIGEHEAGQHWWLGMSRFQKLAYVRIKREVDGGGAGSTKRPGLTSPVERRIS